MKVLLYAHSFAPNVGGAETLALLLARGASERVRLTVATRTPAGVTGDAAFPFAVVRRPRLQALTRLIRDADVVHLAGPVLAPLVMGHLLRKPVVVEHHGYQAVCPNGLLFLQPSNSPCSGRFMEARYGACVRCRASSVGWLAGVRSVLLTFPRRWLASHASNIAVSRHVARRLQLPGARIIYHGVPQPQAAPPTACEAEVPTIGYVGRMVREKGLPVLLDAAAMLARDGHRCHLLIVGDGPERVELEQCAARLGVAAEFTGTLQGRSLEAAAGRIDVAVMPSIWEETAGLAAMEAMRRGTALIASATGGLSEIVQGGGILVEPGNAEALAEAISRLIENYGRRTALGEAARRRADSAFTVERMVEEHLELWSRAAAW